MDASLIALGVVAGIVLRLVVARRRHAAHLAAVTADLEARLASLGLDLARRGDDVQRLQAEAGEASRRAEEAQAEIARLKEALAARTRELEAKTREVDAKARELDASTRELAAKAQNVDAANEARVAADAEAKRLAEELLAAKATAARTPARSPFDAARAESRIDRPERDAPKPPPSEEKGAWSIFDAAGAAVRGSPEPTAPRADARGSMHPVSATRIATPAPAAFAPTPIAAAPEPTSAAPAPRRAPAPMDDAAVERILRALEGDSSLARGQRESLLTVLSRFLPRDHRNIALNGAGDAAPGAFARALQDEPSIQRGQREALMTLYSRFTKTVPRA